MRWRTADPLSESGAEAYVAGVCFKTGPPGRVGVELEWLVHDIREPPRPVALSRIETALRDLATSGRLSLEPGGQVELSSQPADSLTACVEAVQADLSRLFPALARVGLAPHGAALDPVRSPRRVLDLPRYAAMEEFFDRDGPAGRIMMCSTASVQVCLDAGQDVRRRWQVAYAIAPVLLAAFANSPIHRGRPTGWRSTRWAVWHRLDPTRTRAPAGDDPALAWARYALDARVLCVRRDGASWTVPEFTFRDWLRGAGPRPATLDDLRYHLTTLFPPVRPHGWLELRVIDAQDGDGWLVPLAVTTALMEDPRAADAALAATERLGAERLGAKARDGALLLHAARWGLCDPALATAARACFAAAYAALPRLGAGPETTAAVARFLDRYVERGRCPADDRLEDWCHRAQERMAKRL
ncbi:hypothetical protein LI90_2630 [Carbonactinospora thermoautotrophica]|uniref:Glutamate--cysteine ligase EgtA n=1 Tax=Carbonactinospora thermoautotrophica TaxID=1469144 RepID=A0A132MUK8_9ACTN|nr:ergothioneine biosynthesis glutamate--cysteine ligase EgtA [Carbonactinospora thermoautotrophica]KWX01598.1 hypothetical protein LI90_2630 [Carbonactinospora thermoautotrophica]